MLATTCILPDRASTLHISLLAYKSIVHTMKLTLEPVIIGPPLAHEVRNVIDDRYTFIAVFRQIILISIFDFQLFKIFTLNFNFFLQFIDVNATVVRLVIRFVMRFI